MAIIRLLILILFSSSAFGKYDLSICAIFQNEAPYLKEWIEFHKLQGVQHFFLYNNNSEDGYRDVLEPYIQNNEATLMQWQHHYEKGDADLWHKIQSQAYVDCINHYGDQTAWLAVIDIDEFLFCPTGETLPKFLADFTVYGGVCVNWLVFGTSQVEDIPPGSLMIELLTRCLNPEHSFNRSIKSIVQPVHVDHCFSAHCFIYKNNMFAVDAEHMPIEKHKRQSPHLHIDRVRINHYWTRTKNFLRNHKIPSRVKRRNEKSEKLLMKADAYNECCDTQILQFVPRLRHAMGFDN